MGKLSNTRSNVQSSPSRHLMSIRLILLTAVLLVFGRILSNEFVNWDDNPLIYSNPNIANPTFTGLLHHWNPKDPNNSEMYDPLVFTLWWSLAHVAQLETPDFLGSKLNPYVYHAANLLVHILSACVVLEILRRLKIGDWAALAGALIFAIHPIQTEAVVWATAMKDLLSGLLALLAIWRYIAALQSTDRRRKRNYLLATICFAAALLSKPSTVVVPAIVAAIDRIIYGRSWRDIGKWIWPWLLLASGCAALTIWVQPPHPFDVGPMWARPLIAMDALAFYLYKIFLPIRLSFDYGRNPAAVLSDPTLHHPLYWTWIFPLAAAVILRRLKRPALTVAGLIFLLGLLPVLGLKTFVFQYYTTVADRYVYISMLGAGMAVGWLMQRFRNRLAIGVFLLLIALLGSLSFVQAGRWKDTETLYDFGLRLNETRALHYLIFGDYKDHVAESAESIKDQDANFEQAADLYREAIRLEPKNTNGYDRLARDLVRLNRIPEAIDVVRQWIAIDPQIDEKLREKPGSLEALLGSLYLKNGQYPQAIASLKRSLQLLPDPDTHKLLDAATRRAGSAH
jgi:tetratricopeptide (TPR) repeat protein